MLYTLGFAHNKPINFAHWVLLFLASIKKFPVFVKKYSTFPLISLKTYSDDIFMRAPLSRSSNSYISVLWPKLYFTLTIYTSYYFYGKFWNKKCLRE